MNTYRWLSAPAPSPSAARRVWNSSFRTQDTAVWYLDAAILPHLLWVPGWAASHSLLGARLQHCSWASPGSVLLLGGLNTPLSELLQDGGGGSTEAFPLKYETKLGYLSDSDFKQ